MKKNYFFIFALIFVLFGCTNLTENQSGTLTFTSDESSLYFSRTVQNENSNFMLIIKIEGEYSDSKQISVTSEQIKTNKIPTIQFEKIPIDLKIKINVTIQDENNEIIAFGQSKEFTILKGENDIQLDVERILPDVTINDVFYSDGKITFNIEENIENDVQINSFDLQIKNKDDGQILVEKNYVNLQEIDFRTIPISSNKNEKLYEFLQEIAFFSSQKNQEIPLLINLSCDYSKQGNEKTFELIGENTDFLNEGVLFKLDAPNSYETQNYLINSQENGISFIRKQNSIVDFNEYRALVSVYENGYQFFPEVQNVYEFVNQDRVYQVQIDYVHKIQKEEQLFEEPSNIPSEIFFIKSVNGKGECIITEGSFEQIIESKIPFKNFNISLENDTLSLVNVWILNFDETPLYKFQDIPVDARKFNSLSNLDLQTFFDYREINIQDCLNSALETTKLWGNQYLDFYLQIQLMANDGKNYVYNLKKEKFRYQ